MKRRPKRKKIIKKRKSNTPEDKPISIYSTIGIIIYILLALYLLAKTGGNGQGWYRGKPFAER